MSTAEVYNEDMRRKALKASGDDLIRRRDVINAIFDAPIADLFDVTVKKSDIISAVIQIQSESKRGKWESGCFSNLTYKYRCSLCKCYHRARYDYCPSCGAEMVGEV